MQVAALGAMVVSQGLAHVRWSASDLGFAKPTAKRRTDLHTTLLESSPAAAKLLRHVAAWMCTPHQAAPPALMDGALTCPKCWYPHHKGDLRVVMCSTLVGMRTGPLTLRRLSFAPLIRSAHTAGRGRTICAGWKARGEAARLARLHGKRTPRQLQAASRKPAHLAGRRSLQIGGGRHHYQGCMADECPSRCKQQVCTNCWQEGGMKTNRCIMQYGRSSY